MSRRGSSWLTLACFILGGALGLVWPSLFGHLDFLGTLYVNLLKLMALPVVICTVFSAAAQGAKKASGTLGRTLLLFVLLFAVSFLLAALLYIPLAPGKGLQLSEGVAWPGTVAAFSMDSFLEGIFSANIFSSLGAGAMLPCILFAFCMGIAAEKTRAGRLVALVQELESVFSRMLSYVLWLTPLGVFVLMGRCTASFGAETLRHAMGYVLYAWGGCLLVLLAVMILPLWLLCRIGPIAYFRRMGRVLLTAISTCSSAATLPETLRTCREEFDVSDQITGVVAPLGCTIHMCGGAVSFCLLGLVALQMTGRPLTGSLFFAMLVLAEALNMAAPGIPGGGIVLGATYLGMLGFEDMGLFLGIYAGVYRLLDMAYTALNVAGDVTANLLIDRWEKKA